MESIIKIGVGLMIIVIIGSTITSCNERNRRIEKQRHQTRGYNVNIQQTSLEGADLGLDLRAVGGLLKTVKTGEDLEKKLNDVSVGVNNLDLNEDDQVDYIQVTEYGTDDIKGFSLSVELGPEDTQEIATIEIEKVEEAARVQAYGNRHIYGNNHYYHSSFGVTDFLLMAWLYDSMRPAYYSPWGYNRYPGHYQSYRPLTTNAYQKRIATLKKRSAMTSTSKSQLSKPIDSPNKNKNAKNIKAPLKNPTSAQKSFQARNPSKKVASGGFGRPVTSTSKVNPSVKSHPSYRSGSFLGGGK